ncbi:MAG: ankyrin repeat domain-containing protein [candidate division WOR-3 bacterium]
MKKALLLMFIPLLIAAFWEKKLGGLTAEQAFTDARVARLVKAASSGNFKEVDAQLRAGADVNAVGAQGVTPLIWVLTTHNLKAVEHLLKSGANPNYRDPERGVSAMYFASGGNNPKLLELLLKYGGDPNLRGENTETMLQVAASECRRENIDILLQHGADINGHDGLRRSAAHSALTRACFDITVYLLERGLTYELRHLAKSVEGTIIRDNSDQKRWQDRAIEILKERGVKFPANVTRVERDPSSKELWQTLDQAFPDQKQRDAYIKKYGFPYNAYYVLKLEKIMPDRAKREAWLDEYQGDARDAYNAKMLELRKDSTSPGAGW